MASEPMLGELLKSARKLKGVTLRSAGKSMGFGYGHLCELENEVGYNPTVITLDRLSKFYGLPINELFQAALNSIRAKARQEN